MPPLAEPSNTPSTIDSYNLALARGSSDFDVRHNLSLSYVYDLPFFRTPGLANKIAGGWQFSGIWQTQTGTPFSVIHAFSPTTRASPTDQVPVRTRIWRRSRKEHSLERGNGAPPFCKSGRLYKSHGTHLWELRP